MTGRERNLRSSAFQDLNIDRTWTLFLDRDGVINKRIQGNYVRDWTQFKFLPFAAEAIVKLSKLFGIIIVITNQRGVARNLVSEKDLSEIHKRMTEAVLRKGGRIDQVYVCPHELNEQCSCRKPKPGLAFQAKIDFPSIDFSRSVMVGDDVSDIILAKALKMKSILLTDSGNTDNKVIKADFIFKDLLDFALQMEREST